MKKTLIVIIVILVLLLVSWFVFQDDIIRYIFSPRDSAVPEDALQGKPDTEKQVETSDDIPLTTIIAENLEIPWDIEFLQNGDLLVTERPGRLVRIDGEGVKHSIDVAAVKHEGEGGLLGLALHPNYEENNWVYVYITGHLLAEEGSGTVNRVLRYVYKDDQLSEEATILDNIPGALFHNGGQLAFGPDGYLYITTGDAREPALAQDINSLAGKILRITDTGGFVEDNPFFRGDHTLAPEAGYVYAYGSRNAQGLAWDSNGRLWSTEHGRSGVLSGLDELNRIEKGGNYGWPDSQGDTVLENTIAPILHSGPDVTWAPASLAFWQGDPYPMSLFFGGLRGQTLYEVVLADELSELIETTDQYRTLKTHFVQEFGRIRAVVTGPDNMLYISTSNLDGRGGAQEGDDKIIRINPNLLE